MILFTLVLFLLRHDLKSSRLHQTITSETNSQMMCSRGIQTVEDSSLRDKGIWTTMCRYHCGGHVILRLDDGMVNMTAMASKRNSCQQLVLHFVPTNHETPQTILHISPEYWWSCRWSEHVSNSFLMDVSAGCTCADSWSSHQTNGFMLRCQDEYIKNCKDRKTKIS